MGPRDEGQRAPDPGALPVGAAVGAVSHVLEGEAFHVGPRLEQPALRVLQAPEPGLEVVDELQRPEHQPVALLQAPRPPGQGLRELAADRGRPDDLEVAGRKLGVVPVQDVTFDRGLALQVQARDLPAQGLEGPADAPGCRRKARAASFDDVASSKPGPGNQPERGHDAGQQQGGAEELSQGRGAVGAFRRPQQREKRK